MSSSTLPRSERQLQWVTAALAACRSQPSVHDYRCVCLVDAVRELSERHALDPARVAFATLLRFNDDTRQFRMCQAHDFVEADRAPTAADCAPYGLDLDLVSAALSTHRDCLRLHGADVRSACRDAYQTLEDVSAALDRVSTDERGHNVLGHATQWTLGYARPKVVLRTPASVNIACALLCNHDRPLHMSLKYLQILVKKLTCSDKVLQAIIQSAEQECREEDTADVTLPSFLTRTALHLSPTLDLALFHERLRSGDDKLVACLCENMCMEGEPTDELASSAAVELTTSCVFDHVDDPTCYARMFANGCFMLRYSDRRLPPSARQAADARVPLPPRDRCVELYPAAQ